MTPDRRVVVLGCGPAGAAASMVLSARGAPHAIADKATFPRDKVCGDAVSSRGLEVLARYYPDEVEQFAHSHLHAHHVKGIEFTSPSSKSVKIPFPMPGKLGYAGFVARREHFDHFLFQLAARHAHVQEGTEYEAQENEKGFTLKTNGESVAADFIIAADGCHSRFRKLIQGQDRPKQFCASVRAYCRQVEGTDPDMLELRFLKHLLPGYLWVFPMPNGEANIGLGILSSEVAAKKLNLRKLLVELVHTHPDLRGRFEKVEFENEPKGFGIPIATRWKPLHYKNVLLTGDAGSLVDPFTGEGIGNAIISGTVAAELVADALEQGKSAQWVGQEYEKRIRRRLWPELSLSYRMQRLATRPWLFNFVVNRIAGSKELQQVFTNMFTDLDSRTQMKNPLFYLRLLFK